MGKQIKAVFFDIDGTFYDHNTNMVMPSSLEACRLLKQNGYKIVLCSGRPLDMAEELDMFSYFEWDGYIGNSGGSVYDEKFNIIHQDFYTKQQITEIYEIAKKHNIVIFSFGEHDFVWNHYNEASRKMVEAFHLVESPVKDWEGEDLTCICIMDEEDDTIPYFKNIEGLFVQRATPFSIEFYKENINKYEGIKHLMKYWGFKENEYIGFGDSGNDIEMLEHGNIGVAMGNSSDKVKNAADIVCGNSDTDAIYETMRQLKLI